MSSHYNPKLWYWKVAGSATQVYSGAAVGYVLVTDATYTAWLALGNSPSEIASEAELWEVLAKSAAPEAISMFNPAGQEKIAARSTFSDNYFTVQDYSDPTKKFRLQVDPIATGQVRTWSVPDASSTFVGTDTVQTLTNKTLVGAVTTPATTVAGLGAAGTVGRRGFATDSVKDLMDGPGEPAVGGGAKKTPVYDDGTTWRIG